LEERRRTDREREAGRPEGFQEAAQVGNGKCGLFSLPGADSHFQRREIKKEECSLNGNVHAGPQQVRRNRAKKR
jgi:hypothetical protein